MCRTDGCTAPPYVRGLCRSCYQRERGERLGPCLVAACGKPQHSRGLCLAHYFRMWRRERASA